MTIVSNYRSVLGSSKRLAALMAAVTSAVFAQPADRRPQIDVESYRIEATLDPRLQNLAAKVNITFVPQEDRTLSAVFELNNAMNVASVTDGAGRPLSAARQQQEHSVRVTFPEPLAKGTPQTIQFQYDGRLTGQEESPVYGVRFASIQPDFGYLLYPARWFPISGYTTDRYTAEIRITLPAELRAVSSGIERKEGNTYIFTTNRPAFPGSIGIVSGAAQRVSSGGITCDVYFRGDKASMAQPVGEEAGKVMTYLTSIFGLPPSSNLILIQTEAGAPTGYSAPGLLFLSPGGIGSQPQQRVLANQLARQWWGNLISPASRNHLWIPNGIARYSETLYQEHLNGPNAVEPEVRDLYVDALTVTDVPLRQASRLEDYSPELVALTGSKGAAVLNMLRWIMGDEKFGKMLKTLTDSYANQSIGSDEFRKIAEATYGQSLQGFFIQWLESTGAPEFQLEYTTYRTAQGFRVRGKISQDLDTFRMPVDIRIETEGNPEEKRVEVVGTSSEFIVDTFGKPKKVVIDPSGRVLRFSPEMRVAVAIRRGEQFAEIGEFNEALKEYQKALDVNRASSLAHYRVGEIFFLQGNYQSAANEFREVLNGDYEPKWTEVWAHIQLGKIFDITQQRERALNEYRQAVRTKDNTQGAQEEAAKYLKAPYERPARGN